MPELGGDGGGGQLEEEEGGDWTGGGGGGEARGWQGLSQEVHIVHETPAGDGTHTSSIVLAVDSEVESDVASNESSRRRIGNLAMETGE